MKYQTYPAYKDSGVEWLREVPEHWNVAGFKKYLNEIVDYRGKTPEKHDSGIFLVTARNIKNGKIDYDASQEFISEDDYAEVMSRGKPKIGDLLFTTEAPLGEVASVDREDIALAQRIIKFDGQSGVLNNFYLKYLIISSQFQQSLMMFASGSTALGIKAERFVYLRSLIPPFPEQQKVAQFLDHETAKIDTLIEKQQRLIELLKEKRQAVISHAVTKGLNPNAPMKDSGVEWLGEVPEHWVLPKIKWFFKTESGGTPNTAKFEQYYQDGEIPWIRTTDLNNGELFETPVSITNQAVIDSACSLLPENTVLVAMYGGAGSIGKHALLKFKSTINQAVCAILPNEKIAPDFLHLYVEFYRPYWMVGAEGTRKDPNINQETIRELVISCPPVDEQIYIVEVTKKKLSVVDEIISKSEANIELMQERRTALISAAVTGKIDVRNWNAPNA
jgi:type I restriction enzyme S subunit